MGNRTLGSNVSIYVNGCTRSNFLSSGRIFAKLLDVSLAIAHADRISGKSFVSATVAFTSLATIIPTGSNITLNYPPNFFAISTPYVQAGATSVAGLAVTCSSPGFTSVVLTTSAAVIGTSPFVVTISGFTMGSSGANVTDGISITTSVHPDPSDGVDSGILSCPPGSYWTGAPPTCTQCHAGTYQNGSNEWSCTPCPPGQFCNQIGLVAVSGICPAGSYSPSGANTSSCIICSHGLYNTQLGQSSIAACFACNRTGFATTKERDRCVTLQFAQPPPSVVYSSDAQAFLPAVSLVDVDGNVVRERSGVVLAILHCSSPCDSELSATVSAYDLFPAISISIVNGTSSRAPFWFTESSLVKIGMRYVWRFTSTQENVPSSNSIPTLSALFPNVSFMGAAPVYDVTPTIMASVGGTVLTVQGEWVLPARLQPFFNSSAFCEFEYFSNSSGASTTVRFAAFDASSANLKTCLSPPIAEFTSANVTMVFQDGRRRRTSATVTSVCHHGFYVDGGKCVRCPSSSLGRSTNNAINAPSVQACVCDVGSYGTYGSNCWLCPRPATLNPPPFTCNSANIRYPLVVPGYWADFSLLPNCVGATSAPCDAVKSCAFGDRACPGRGDKSCTQNELECYEGVACSTCCATFYVENDVCTKCPDSSQTTVILAVVGTVCVVAAALTTSSPSPSLMHSFKYFIVVINFVQRIFSLDLIKINWPHSISSLFAWLKLFTLSVNIVRPECSFNWNFQTKVVLTLITPVCVSLIILCCGVVYGWHSCRTFWFQVNRIPNFFNYKAKLSLLALFQFWMNAVLSRNAELNCQNATWVAFYPVLAQRRRRRKALPASENWENLRQKIQSARTAVHASMPFQSRSQRMRFSLEHFETFESAQQSARSEGFDLSFSQIVTNGRKFASTMFSVLVITFIGTLTSVLSVWNCKLRDGKMYLSEDVNIECSLESPDYLRMFSVSMFGLVLYGVALPASIFFIFRSSWCKQMVIYDFGAFESLFGFLTSRYASKFYMWEVVIFIQKTISVLVPSYVSDPVQQSVFMTLATLLYLILIFIYSPFANELLNFVEKLANLNIFLFYFSALMFVVEVDGVLVLEGTLKELMGIFLCALCALSVAAAFSCAWYEWVQLAVLHKIKIISNWMKCLRFALGSTFSGDSAFALLFVLYNPVSRKDVANKQHQFNQKLATALLPLHQSYVGKSRFFLFGIKKAWICFKFATRHFDDDCSPVSVLAAVNEPHAAFVKHVTRLNMLINKSASDREKQSSSLLHKIQNWGRRNKVCPEPAARDVDSDAPKRFIEEFVAKRDFIAENVDEEARLTVITLLLFIRNADFTEDIACQHYLDKLFGDGAACRAAMRAIFDASEELSKRSAAGDAYNGALVSTLRRVQSRVLASVFGQDMVKSIECFHRLDNEQQSELMKNHNFPEADSINFSAPTADSMLAQYLAAGKAGNTDAAQQDSDFKSYGELGPGVATAHPAAASMFQPIGTAVEDVQYKSSVSQKSLLESHRLLDLETELSELKRLLGISKNEADSFRAEADTIRAQNAELKKALAAVQPKPVQNPI
jgi:hypothetical protein